MDVLTDRGQNAFWSTLSRVSTLLWHRCGSPHSGSSVGPHILGPLWVPTSGASAGSYLVIPQRVPTFWVPTSHISIVASLWVPTVTFWVHCGFPLWSLRGSRPIVCNSTEGSHTTQGPQLVHTSHILWRLCGFPQYGAVSRVPTL